MTNIFVGEFPEFSGLDGTPGPVTEIDKVSFTLQGKDANGNPVNVTANYTGVPPTPTPTPVPNPPPAPPSPHSPLVAVVNQSTVISDDQVKAIVAALQVQCDRDFAQFWNTTCHLTFVPKGTQPSPAAWQLVFLDDSDMAGALGYHDVTPAGLPLGKVFAKTDAQYGLQSSVTASHELLEMLADPYIDNLSGLYPMGTNQDALVAHEVCDPVEADNLGYTINGSIRVSDFVTPAWFHPGMPGPFSFQGHVTASLQLAHGGYISYLVLSTSGWQQATAELDAEQQAAGHPRINPQPGSRRERRIRGHENWVVSEVVNA